MTVKEGSGNKALTREVARVKNLTKNQFEEIGVFMDMEKFIGKEYEVLSKNDWQVELRGRHKIVLPLSAVEFAGEREISPNSTMYNKPTEKNERTLSRESSGRHKFKKRFY